MRHQVPRQRSRAHKILFDRDLPFKPHRVESKVNYRRKTKHPHKQQEV